jgi:6,7-dimethyl-8-ribityllumazine synthase
MSGALDCLHRHGVDDEQIDTAWVPGGFEIPMAAKRFVQSGRYAAVICVGCVIQGDTPHFHYVSSEVTKGIAQVSLDSDIPVVYGIITAENLDQAIERSGTKAGNKGFDAALTALEMIDLCAEIDAG